MSHGLSGNFQTVPTSIIWVAIVADKVSILRGLRGGLGSNLEIFLVLTHMKIWIFCDMNLFTELKNLERFPRYDFAKMGRTAVYESVFGHMYGISCKKKRVSKWPLGKFFSSKNGPNGLIFG